MIIFDEIYQKLDEKTNMRICGKGIITLIFRKDKLPHIYWEKIATLEILKMHTETFCDEPTLYIELETEE